MKQKHFAIAILISLMPISVNAQNQQVDMQQNFSQDSQQLAMNQDQAMLEQPLLAQNEVPQGSPIQSTNAGGESQMTIIDQGGNLKMIDKNKPVTSGSGPSAPAASQQGAIPLQAEPGLTPPAHAQSAPAGMQSTQPASGMARQGSGGGGQSSMGASPNTATQAMTPQGSGMQPPMGPQGPGMPAPQGPGMQQAAPQGLGMQPPMGPQGPGMPAPQGSGMQQAPQGPGQMSAPSAAPAAGAPRAY